MKVLYCPICQKPIQECECGDGCDVCGVRKAFYALQVCGECVELARGELCADIGCFSVDGERR